MKNSVFIGALLCIICFTSCSKPKGCTDPNALSYDSDAKKDDGSCIYSKVIFFKTQSARCPPVIIFVNGSPIGTLDATYPSGPGNCTATGCPTYTFKSGQAVDWEARDNCGNILNGRVSPNRFDCLSVKVF